MILDNDHRFEAGSPTTWSIHVSIVLAVLSFTEFVPDARGQEADADALARELSNPASSLASLGNKFEIRTYDGDLPGADDETGYRYIFQPALPFDLSSGDKIIFRPAFNVPISEPFFDTAAGRFDTGGGFGDIGFDLVYAPKLGGGWVLGGGMVGGLPTGTNEDLRSENWTAGPEILGAYIQKWGLIGGLFSHSWDVAGSGADTSLTSLQYFYFLSLGGGWQVGAGPTATYDWEAAPGNRWNVPVGLGIAKTAKIGGLTIKFNVEADYSVVRQDDFGPEWLFKFNITPVIANPFQ